MARKNKLTPAMINKASGLASKGFTHKQVCQSIGIGNSSLYTPAYRELLETIRKAEHELREKITDSILEGMEEDTTLKIFLSKRLSLFHTSYRLPPIKSAEQALKELSKLNTALSEGEIPIELHSALTKNISEWVKIKEVSEYEVRLAKLEEVQNVK